MTHLPKALCLHPHTGAVIGWWDECSAMFPADWNPPAGIGDLKFLTVPIPEWLMDYAGHPFCLRVPKRDELAEWRWVA